MEFPWLCVQVLFFFVHLFDIIKMLKAACPLGVGLEEAAACCMLMICCFCTGLQEQFYSRGLKRNGGRQRFWSGPQDERGKQFILA